MFFKIKTGLLEIIGSHQSRNGAIQICLLLLLHCKGGNILEMVQDKDVVTTDH